MLTTQQAASLRKQIQSSNVAVHRTTFERAGLLYKASKETVQPKGSKNVVPLFMHWGFVSWEDYVKREVGISKSTSIKHMDAFEFWCVTLKEGRDWKEPPVGIDKMILLTPVVRSNPKSADQWLRRAAAMTTLELARYIKTGKLPSSMGYMQYVSDRARVDGLRNNMEAIRNHVNCQYGGRFDVFEAVAIHTLTHLNAGGTLP